MYQYQTRIWVKVSRKGPSKICGRQSLKKFKRCGDFFRKSLVFGCLYFAAPGPLLGPSPGPQFVFTALVPNLYLPALASNWYLPALDQNLHLKALLPNLCLPALAPYLCLPVLTQICIDQPWPRFAFTSPDQNFPTTTATSTITITATSTTTTNTTTATTTIATTANDNNNNKRCIRGKTRIKWPLKDIWWKSQVLF